VLAWLMNSGSGWCPLVTFANSNATIFEDPGRGAGFQRLAQRATVRSGETKSLSRGPGWPPVSTRICSTAVGVAPSKAAENERPCRRFSFSAVLAHTWSDDLVRVLVSFGM